MEQFWKLCKIHLMSHLHHVNNSEEGAFYEKLNARYSSFVMSKKSGIVILGKDNGPELDELLMVKDYVSSKGYNADMIKGLPEIPMMSLDEKVRMWTISSRFCIMLDIQPSGHIKEYEILKQQRTVLAVLRQKGKGSTYMIGDDEIDSNHIRIFEFDKSPIGILNEVIQWCEGVNSKRTGYYDHKYPWRNRK